MACPRKFRSRMEKRFDARYTQAQSQLDMLGSVDISTKPDKRRD